MRAVLRSFQPLRGGRATSKCAFERSMMCRSLPATAAEKAYKPSYPPLIPIFP